MPRAQKARGTREEVWSGSARRTSGGLVKDDLMLNKRGKLVSKKQSLAASGRYPELKKKLCETVFAVPAPVEAALARPREDIQPPPPRVVAPPPDVLALIRAATEAHLGFGPSDRLTQDQKRLFAGVFTDIRSQVEARQKQYGDTLQEAVGNANYAAAIARWRR